MNLNFSGFWGSTTNSQTMLLDYFDHQEQLPCDPVYLAITFGNVYLLYLKLKEQHQIEAERLKKEGKTISPLGAIRISFKNSGIEIQEPGLFSQTLPRLWSGETRTELRLIRPHLIKLLRWFDYEDPNYKTILKMCKLGIGVILEGYKNLASQKMTVTQTLPTPPDKQEAPPPIVIDIQTIDPEVELVISRLEGDMALLEDAVKNKDERSAQELKIKLAQEEAKYFPMHRLHLIKVAKTIDEYMAEKVKSRWTNITLEGIVKIFNADPNESFNRYEAIASLIRPNPAEHAKLKGEIKQLTLATTPNCQIQMKTSTSSKKE
jgi:hypothetical protein